MLTFSFFICASLACEKKVSIWLGLVLLQLFLDNIKMQYLLYFILSPLNICPQGNNMPIAIQSVITWTYFHLMLSFQKAVFLTLSDSLQMVPIIVFSLTKRFKKCTNAPMQPSYVPQKINVYFSLFTTTHGVQTKECLIASPNGVSP